MNKLKTLAMVDVAEHLLKQNKGPMQIQTIFEKVAEIKEISLDDVDKLTQLYMDITSSGKFVYFGDNEDEKDRWGLKTGNLHLWDDDGSSFIKVEEEVEEEELEYVDMDDIEEDEIEEDDEYADLDPETKKEIEEEKEYIEVELPLESTDDDVIELDADNYDEEDYNKIMDDYEDMYDDE